MEKINSLGTRLIEAFGTNDKATIAEKLGFSSVQGVYKILSGERELDFRRLQNFRDYTKCSIDWLLTGKGEKEIERSEPINLDETLRSVIREIVQDEVAKERRKLAMPLDVGKKKKGEKKVA